MQQHRRLCSRCQRVQLRRPVSTARRSQLLSARLQLQAAGASTTATGPLGLGLFPQQLAAVKQRSSLGQSVRLQRLHAVAAVQRQARLLRPEEPPAGPGRRRERRRHRARQLDLEHHQRVSRE